MTTDLPDGVRLLPSGRYQARVQIDGSRHTSTHTTIRDAVDWMTVTEARHITGTLPAGATIRQYAVRWLTGYDDAPTRTRANYEVDLRLRIVPALGTRRVRDITPTDITRLLNRVRQRQSTATADHTYRTLSALFRSAEQDGLCDKSPVRSKRHRPRQQPEAMTVWTRDQARAVVMEMDGYQQDAVLLQLALGARIGEVAALTPADIDLQAGTVTIARGVTHLTVRSTKNHRRRVLDVPSSQTDRLARLINQCVDPVPLPAIGDREWDATAWDWRWLLTTQTGRPIYPDVVNPALAAAAKAAGAPRLSSHGLRHTFVSWMVDDGHTLAQVAQWIGDTMATTATVYAHMLDGGSAPAAASIDRALDGL